MLQKEKGDIHLFTTSHPYFIDLGLGSFTTGTLIDWWNQQDGKGRYLNRRYINPIKDQSDPLATGLTYGLNSLLGIHPDTEFFWYGWKPNINIENAGRFKKQNLYSLESHYGGEPADSWKYEVNTIHDLRSVSSLTSSFSNMMPLVSLSLKENGDPDPFFPSEILDPYYAPLRSLSPIYGLIQLNKYITLYDDYYPRATWDVEDTTTHPSLSQQEAFGSWALLSEIKAAKGGPFIQWSGDVTFHVGNSNPLLDRCTITENVVFTLYLGDESMMKAGSNAVTIKNLVVVGPKRDAFGAAPGLDGERVETAQNDVANHVAAEIDLQYDPVKKKMQSGNVNVLAKLVSDLPPAKQAPELGYLLDADIKEMLEDPDNKFSYIPSRGYAMPIRVQNAMPLQWAPNYAITKDSRCVSDNREKQIVPVFNFNTRKFYPSGEEVMLTEINKMWHVTSLGEPNAEPSPVVSTSIGKWGSFSYLATSSQFFFKGYDTNGQTVTVTPRSAELNFHQIFYENAKTPIDKQLNWKQAYGPRSNITGDQKPIGGYNISQPFDTSEHVQWYDLDGWFQTTSFDYLDSKIFGIRGKPGSSNTNGDKCSISSTSATLNAAGNVIPFDNSNYPYRNAAHTSTFFGCVFPQGYQGTQAYNNPDWTVQPTGETAISNGIVNPLNYFSIPATQSNPFDNNPARNNANAKCQATQNDPYAIIAPDEQGFLGANSWVRGVINPDASMFYLGATEGRKTIPADVMLNASPNGKNGSPLKPIGLFNNLNRMNFNINNIGNVVNGGAWLCKVPRVAGGTIDPYSSAFDFEPFDKGNIMFRPLKMEAYLQFGVPFAYGKEKTFAENLLVDFAQESILGFYTEAARTQIDFTFPISYFAPLRESGNCYNNLAGYENGKGSAAGPLKWGGWTRFKPGYTRLHRKRYWDASIGAMRWTATFTSGDPYSIDPASNWNGAGAFGVITTSNKVKTNTKIEFVTKNLYGMSAAAGDVPSNALGEFLGLPARQRPQDQTWGVGNFIESYRQENIADLSVRIYQGHPTNLTLYDPRYFAVHHFNPGVELLYDKYYGTGTIPVNELGQGKPRPRNYSSIEFRNIRGNNGVILDKVKYAYPQPTGVDIKVPSRYVHHLNYTFGDSHVDNSNGQHYLPVALSVGTNVFSDGTQENGQLKPQLLPEDYWDVDTVRTGKLLPFQYYQRTLSSPAGGLGSDVDFVIEDNAKSGRVIDYPDKLIVKNFGTNYASGDTIGLSDYNLIFKVTQVDQTSRAITKLEVVYPGSGLPTNLTQPTGDIIGNFAPRFNLSTITSAEGTGFNAYFVCTKVKALLNCDPKPYLIKSNGSTGQEIVRIAAPDSGPSHPTQGPSEVAEGGSYVDKTTNVEFSIDSAVKSKDSTYDVFFHFHNDISMTWLACGSPLSNQPHGDRNNISESTEQHITIERINLT